LNKRHRHLSLPDPALIAVVGGGPAGSFFAIRILRGARRLGREVKVVIFEKKREICFYQPTEFCSWEGCNYCAGGISPRLADTLRENGLELPEEIVEGRAAEVIVHGDWKSVELPVPEGRTMLSVFRGSRPRGREGRYTNFDTFLLRTASDEGAVVTSAEVTDISYSASGRPVLTYRLLESTEAEDPSAAPVGSLQQTLEADFAVLAAGVNRRPGMDVASDPLFQSLQDLIPGFRPPRVRQTVIAELEAEDGQPLAVLEGEVHFAQYGSRDLEIEMSSLIPKDRWITVALVGWAIDQASPSELPHLVERFVELPHIRRLLPQGTRFRPACGCHPNMTVGAAHRPFASRIAVTGDMAVSRLYKDGLYSAYVTTAALADCLLEHGIDARCLGRWYAPVTKRFHVDNRYGRAVFLLSSAVFRHPALSRVLYQAILTERKSRPRDRRRLAGVLWRTASGDDSYRRILLAMLHPVSWWLIVTGGLLATMRNKLTEQIFGLRWSEVGRYPTGVPLEEVARKRRELFAMQGWGPPTRSPHVERMYSIRIRDRPETIFRELGSFGEPDRAYLKPRFLRVTRTDGTPNHVGTIIRYEIGLRAGGWERIKTHPLRDRLRARPLSFSVRLEQAVPDRYLLYRILDGFGRGGTFAFDINEVKPGLSLLTTYVGFDFPRGRGLLGRCGWRLLRLIFPAYAHDVLWNHSLCLIKSLAESADQGKP
jgi:flavin-dependent dehydrogenase